MPHTAFALGCNDTDNTTPQVAGPLTHSGRSSRVYPSPAQHHGQTSRGQRHGWRPWAPVLRWKPLEVVTSSIRGLHMHSATPCRAENNRCVDQPRRQNTSTCRSTPRLVWTQPPRPAPTIRQQHVTPTALWPRVVPQCEGGSDSGAAKTKQGDDGLRHVTRKRRSHFWISRKSGNTRNRLCITSRMSVVLCTSKHAIKNELGLLQPNQAALHHIA